jgi:hypothetical protein
MKRPALIDVATAKVTRRDIDVKYTEEMEGLWL